MTRSYPVPEKSCAVATFEINPGGHPRVGRPLARPLAPVGDRHGLDDL
ncbi:MAG TPA: hypothetical protein VE287_03115 [Actinopolymorphaceae bacterium]|nr:hypothetical protein [Actinopolymorphaceae bacterium]